MNIKLQILQKTKFHLADIEGKMEIKQCFFNTLGLCITVVGIMNRCQQKVRPTLKSPSIHIFSTAFCLKNHHFEIFL